MDTILLFTKAELEFCNIYIARTDIGVCRIDFDTYENDFFAWIDNTFSHPKLTYNNGAFKNEIKQLEEYFKKERRKLDFKTDLKVTDFQKRVYNALIRVPYGEAISYKQLAEQIGGANYSRAVGGALNKNPLPIIIPCHRVIGNDGSMTGFAGGLEIKSKLLKLENII